MGLEKCSITLILILFLNLTKKNEVCSEFEMADELEGPHIDFIDYHDLNVRQKTSIVYIDVTEPPPRIVYRRRKAKKKKKNKKKNRLPFLKNIDTIKENIAETITHRNRKKKNKRNRSKGKNFKRWNNLPDAGYSNLRDSSKMSKSYESGTDQRKNPVDIVVHIKMKD